MTTAATLQQIIEKWKVNKELLASKIGMPRGTFNNKLIPTHSSTFTNAELNKLCNVLIELRDELGVIESADFNEALKIITEK